MLLMSYGGHKAMSIWPLNLKNSPYSSLYLHPETDLLQAHARK
jgi:hypothetical protein